LERKTIKTQLGNFVVNFLWFCRLCVQYFCNFIRCDAHCVPDNDVPGKAFENWFTFAEVMTECCLPCFLLRRSACGFLGSSADVRATFGPGQSQVSTAVVQCWPILINSHVPAVQ